MKNYYIYILASNMNSVLYIDVTSALKEYMNIKINLSKDLLQNIMFINWYTMRNIMILKKQLREKKE